MSLSEDEAKTLVNTRGGSSLRFSEQVRVIREVLAS
jgi:hypothetical protein